MASDLQDQVTDLQQRARNLECECDELRTQRDRSDSIAARKAKESQVRISTAVTAPCIVPQRKLHWTYIPNEYSPHTPSMRASATLFGVAAFHQEFIRVDGAVLLLSVLLLSGLVPLACIWHCEQ